MTSKFGIPVMTVKRGVATVYGRVGDDVPPRRRRHSPKTLMSRFPALRDVADDGRSPSRLPSSSLRAIGLAIQPEIRYRPAAPSLLVDAGGQGDFSSSMFRLLTLRPSRWRDVFVIVEPGQLVPSA